MAAKPKHVLSEAKLAAILGIATSTWKLDEIKGCPTPTSQQDLQPWLMRYHAWRKKHKQERPAPTQVDAELQVHRRDLTKLRALREKLSLAREQRQMIPRREVVDSASAAVLAANQRLDAMQRRMASRLGPLCQGGAAMVEAIFAEEVQITREQLAQGMARESAGQSNHSGTAVHVRGADAGNQPTPANARQETTAC